MSGRRTILQSATFTLILIAATSAQSPPDARAEEDACLAKPDATTPPGQHWYYRIDHAHNKRQCWHLGPEGGRVQNSEQSEEPQATSDTAVKPTAPLRAQKSTTASQSSASPEPPQDTAAITPVAPVQPVPWIDGPKLPQLTGFLQPAPQAPPATAVRSAGASDAVPATVGQATPDDDQSPSTVNNGQPAHATVAANSAARPQMAAGAYPPRPAITAWGTAEVDHTFAILMVVFAVLAVTGPALHYAEKRRRREAINFRPPRWAEVVTLNAPTPHALDTLPPEPLARSGPALVPAVPADQADQAEKLAQSLQQLIGQLQTKQVTEPSTVRVRPRGLASG